MELMARVKKSGDSWIAEVPEVPGLSARTRSLTDVVDELAAEYENLYGGLPEPFLVSLKIDGESWRMYRPHWPVRSKWKSAWQAPIPASDECERETRAWLRTGRDFI